MTNYSTMNSTTLECKPLPIHIEEDSFVTESGEEKAFFKFYVEVKIDDAMEPIYLRAESGLKKRKLAEYIRAGGKYMLCVREREFKNSKKETIRYAAFYTPMDVGGVKCDMRFSIDVGKNGDNVLERTLVLRALGLSYDSIEGLSSYDEVEE